MIAGSAPLSTTHPPAGLEDRFGEDDDAPWRKALARAIRDPAELLTRLGLELRDWLEPARRASRRFGLLVPEAYLARIRPGDPNDPLLRQILPRGEEEEPPPVGYVLDPLRETVRIEEGGILAKYQARVLLVTTGICAIHCRYCFRRHFPYQSRPLMPTPAILASLRERDDLREVILSGGDPLMLSTRRLRCWSEALATLPALRVLRLHTRLPVVLPERIDGPLLHWFETLPLQPVVVIHANHPQEIDDAVRQALQALRRRGVSLLNQSVLLAGVNDDADVLAELSWRLWECGVGPYYLHRLDPVVGAAHFAVSDERARTIVLTLRERLPGYLVPRYVREEPGAAAKVPIL